MVFFTFRLSNELHSLLSKNEWQKAFDRVSKHPTEASKLGICDTMIVEDNLLSNGPIRAYPLHYACALCAPGYLISAIQEAYPKALKLTDSIHRRLPIHYAILSRGCPSTVLMLLEKYPISSTISDTYGRIPLHYALFCKMPIPVIEKIVSVFPMGVKVKDNKGWTPLHMSGAVSIPLPLVRTLVFVCPEVLEVMDDHMLCPRDFFIVHNTVSIDVITFLVSSTPKKMEMCNDVLSLYQDILMKR
jgi:hypothetical protein